MTDPQWARFVEALQVAYAKQPQVFRALVDAMPADARQAFIAGVFGAAADALGPPAGSALQQVAELRDAAEEAADPKSKAYAYPPVPAEEAGVE